MGTHGRTGLDRYLLGCVAERTLRIAAIPVLTAPPADGETEADVPETNPAVDDRDVGE